MYSDEQMLKAVQDKSIETIRLQFTDIQGIVKNVAVPDTSGSERHRVLW
jgi:glutamine synthetase